MSSNQLIPTSVRIYMTPVYVYVLLNHLYTPPPKHTKYNSDNGQGQI
jgi:hypothetical protein